MAYFTVHDVDEGLAPEDGFTVRIPDELATFFCEQCNLNELAVRRLQVKDLLTKEDVIAFCDGNGKSSRYPDKPDTFEVDVALTRVEATPASVRAVERARSKSVLSGVNYANLETRMLAAVYRGVERSVRKAAKHTVGEPLSAEAEARINEEAEFLFQKIIRELGVPKELVNEPPSSDETTERTKNEAKE